MTLVGRDLRFSIATIVIVGLWVVEIVGRGHRMPQNRRIIAQEISTIRPNLASFQFGFELGTGVRTYLPSTLPIAGLAFLLLFGCLSCGIVVGIGFGTGRAAMPVARNRGGDGIRWDQAFEKLLPATRLILTASSVSATLTIAWAA